jgi:hypothetical protein
MSQFDITKPVFDLYSLRQGPRRCTEQVQFTGSGEPRISYSRILCFNVLSYLLWLPTWLDNH